MTTEPTPLKVFLRPERRFVAEGRPTELVVLIRLLPAAPQRAVHVPVNLALVVDRGPTLTGERLNAVKQGLHAAVDGLGPDDSCTIVSVGDAVEVVAPSQRVTTPSTLHRAIDAIQPGPAGPLVPGWTLGGLEAALSYDRRAVNRIVLISDGSAAVGTTERIIDAGRGLFRRGISTTTLGIGDSFAEDALVPLAVQGGGNAIFALSGDEIVEALSQEVVAARSIFSEWATLRFDLDQAEIVDVLNDLPWIGEQKVSLPPLYANTPLNVVVRLRIRPGQAGQDVSPLTVRIKNLDLQARQAVVHRKAMTLHVVSTALADGMGPDLGVQAHAARLEFARMHAKCVRKIDEGDLAGARQILDFSLSRFQSLSGQSGGTLLTADLAAMGRLREHLGRDDAAARNRKFLKFSAVFAQRSGLTRIANG
ncbi:MAG: VWA domain-containing protein [Myxococcales bacterium]|nr:VWA domain-containing protein [Myxococcales bacterium]